MELKITDLSKKFGDFTAVDNLNVTMTMGLYGLLGVNGAGKTTLMRMLCTLLKPTSGTIYCDGNDIFNMDGEYRKLLGYLPQEFGFYPEFTIKDYLLYIASLKGIRPIVAKKRVKELVTKVGLQKAVNKKMKNLSGGMKRRVGIAQAMLNDPKILILDEPTAGLDPNERIRFRNLISELAEDRLVLLSTHTFSGIELITSSEVPLCISFPSFSSQISLAIYSISETIWVDNNTNLSSASSLIRFRNRIRSLGSSPAVGSSRIKILGSFNIACAMPTLRFIPPDKFFIFLFTAFCSPTFVTNSFTLIKLPVWIFLIGIGLVILGDLVCRTIRESMKY